MLVAEWGVCVRGSLVGMDAGETGSGWGVSLASRVLGRATILAPVRRLLTEVVRGR